mmetsp:Transcript_55470/g.131207  ORF Transcript_55470/g.131207 Transcript_55470/m.131207 type:complete len:197 (+) Transcript_55470:118-708(+)
MSDTIAISAHALLEQVFKVLLGRPHLSVRIEGHSCSAPSWGVSNLELSSGRAASVLEHLVQKGIDRARLEARGWGEQLPLKPNSSSEGKQANRRVEFHVLSRESEKALRSMVESTAARERLRKDKLAVAGLRSTASAPGTPMAIRRAAADVLISCGAEWDKERVLWAGVLKGKSAIATLDRDSLREVFRWHLMLPP